MGQIAVPPWVRSNPQGVVQLKKPALVCIHCGNGFPQEIASGRKFSKTGTHDNKVGVCGQSIYPNSSSYYIDIGDLSSYFARSTATGIIVYDAAPTQTTNCPWRLGAGSYPNEFPWNGDGNIYCDDFSSSRWISGASLNLPTSGLSVLVSRAAGSERNLWVNGERRYSASGASFAVPTNMCLLGDTRYGGQAFKNRRIYYAIVDNRYWSDAELLELTKDPFSIFETQRSPTFFGSAAERRRNCLALAMI